MGLRCQTYTTSLVSLKSATPKRFGYPETLESLSDYLKTKRLDLGLLQKDLAKIIRVSEATIHNWETKKSTVQIKYYPKIIEFLGFHPFADKAEMVQDYIRIHREKTGLSIKSLASKIGVDETTVSNYQKGTTSKYISVKEKMELEIPELRLLQIRVN